MALQLNYTDKHRVWDALTAPSNRTELYKLLQDCPHYPPKTRVNCMDWAQSQRTPVASLQVPLPCTDRQIRSASIYFTVDNNGVQRYKVVYWLQHWENDHEHFGEVDSTRYAKFYGKMHLKAILDAVVHRAATVY